MSLFHHVPSPEEQAQERLFHSFDLGAMLMSSPEQLSANRAALYDLFAHATWNGLDGDTKRAALQALENDFAFQERRPARPVEVRPMESGYYGGWDKESGKIYINENLVDHNRLSSNPFAKIMPDANMQLFDTIAHEGYHAYQSYALEHPEIHDDKQQLRSWALNEGRYYKNGNEYLIQPKERDAWRFGQERTKEAFRGIEERNGQEPGRESYEETAESQSYDLALKRAQAREPQILEHMDEEMKEACQEKGIFYDYMGEEATQSMAQEADQNVSMDQLAPDESWGPEVDQNVSMDQLAPDDSRGPEADQNVSMDQLAPDESRGPEADQNVSMDQLAPDESREQPVTQAESASESIGY